MEKKRFIQNYDVSWLNTPHGTIWQETGNDSYIQPVDTNLWETPLGVNLYLLDDEDWNLFLPVEDEKETN